jgi:hypothetical protein
MNLHSLRYPRAAAKASSTLLRRVCQRSRATPGNEAGRLIQRPDSLHAAVDAAYTGDAGAAKEGLDRVVDDLARLRKPAIAGSTEEMNTELLPGVSNAIDQIGKAIQQLRLLRDAGK